MTTKAIDRRYESSDLLRQCQLVEMYLLDVFVEICNKHGLTYFLSYGTLLGAMRHNGFIPWDDDVDVAMPEEDFEKFIRLSSDEFPDSVILETQEITPVLGCWVRLRDRSSTIVSSWTVASRPSGIYMDIYKYCKYPKLPKRLSYLLTKFMTETWWSMWAHRTKEHRTTSGILVSWCKCAIWQCLRAVSVAIFSVLRKILPTVWHGPIEIGFPGGAYPSEVDDSVLFPLRHHVFEGSEYCVPNDSDAYLTQRYGDWRTPPPENEQEWHHDIIAPTEAPRVWWAKKRT